MKPGNAASLWRPPLLDYAQAYAQQVSRDWQEFSTDYRTTLKKKQPT